MDGSVLIPRPETEQVVEAALSLVSSPEARIADIGTGSGNIAIALARERARTEPDFVLLDQYANRSVQDAGTGANGFSAASLSRLSSTVLL